MKKFIGIKSFVMFVVVLFFFAGIYYVFTSKQKQQYSKISPNSITNIEENVSWKTFKNDKIGYSLKYPPDWKLRNEDESGELYMLSNEENMIEIQNYTSYNLKVGQTVENYLDNDPVVRSQPTKRIVINNYTAYLQRGIPDGGELSRATYLHIEHNKKYLNIAIIEGEYEDVSAVLNTIKFGE